MTQASNPYTDLLCDSPSYWADITIRGFETLPGARSLGDHRCPDIVMACAHLAALNDESGGQAWQLGIVSSGVAGLTLDDASPQAGHWAPAEDYVTPWDITPSADEGLLDQMPNYKRILQGLADNSLPYAVGAWSDELGEMVCLNLGDMRLAIRPGTPDRPTRIILPDNNVDAFLQAIEGTQLLTRFQADQIADTARLPRQHSHQWLGVTNDLSGVSRATRALLPEEERPFYVDCLAKIDRSGGNLSALEGPDLRRFNALRHQHLMPAAMMGPIAASEIHDPPYELSMQLCMAGATHRNLDQEAAVLGQRPSLDALDLKVAVHTQAALKQDSLRHQEHHEHSASHSDLDEARLTHNLEIRRGVSEFTMDPPAHREPVSRLEAIRISEPPPANPLPEGLGSGFSEYPCNADFSYRSQMAPLG